MKKSLFLVLMIFAFGNSFLKAQDSLYYNSGPLLFPQTSMGNFPQLVFTSGIFEPTYSAA